MSDFERGLSHFKRKQYADAVDAFKAVGIDSPYYFRALIGIGKSFFNLKRYDDAIAAYDLAIPLAGDRLPIALNGKAVALAECHKLNEAIEIINQAIKLDPTAEALHNCGQILLRMNRAEEAARAFEREVQLNPDDSNARCFLSIALSDAGMQEAAYQHAYHVVARDGRNALGYHCLGLVQARLVDLESALKSESMAICLDPSDADYYFNRGYTFYSLREFENAISDFDKCILYNPDRAKAFTNRGNCYVAIRQLDRAVRDFTVAISLGDTIAYLNRGNCYLAKNELDLAVADYSAGIVSFPNDAQFFIARSTAYERSGRSELSELDYRRAIQLLDPNS